MSRLKHLQKITEALAAALTVPAISNAIVTAGVSALGGRAGSIGLLNDDGSALDIVGSSGYPKDVASAWDSIPMATRSAWVDAAQSCEIVVIPSTQQMLNRYPESADFHEAFGDKAYVAIPLAEHGRCVGVMGVGFSELKSFTVEDLEFMHTIARQGALALERARLYGAERSARADAEAGRRNFEFLAKASRLLASSLDYQATLNATAQAVVPALADWCIIDLAGDDGKVERLTVAHVDPARVAWAKQLQERYPPRRDTDRGVMRVLRTGESEFYPVITAEMLRPAARDEEEYRILQALGLGSVMMVPLAARGRTFGVITFVTTVESGKTYTPEDLQLAEDLGQRAGIAVDNARLYQEAHSALGMHRAAEERLAALTQASGALLTSLKLDQLTPVILNLAERLFLADAYALWRVDRETGLWQTVSHSGLSRNFTRMIRPANRGAVVSLESAIVIEDIDSDPTLSSRHEAHVKEGIRALLVLPLRIRDQSTGTLAFYYRQPHAFTDSDVRVAGAIANLAAAAIGTTELYEEQEDLKAEAVAVAVRQRAFIRDVLASVTEGKL
ncbi:MAG TPA: GAF domain-containing protein, partial [Capsulimonadaceae bacterium]|nr:GAF domain-containing protein [Capsulimonadaceae bacterium]